MRTPCRLSNQTVKLFKYVLVLEVQVQRILSGENSFSEQKVEFV